MIYYVIKYKVFSILIDFLHKKRNNMLHELYYNIKIW